MADPPQPSRLIGNDAGEGGAFAAKVQGSAVFGPSPVEDRSAAVMLISGPVIESP